jgi:hypothetical protein
MMTIAAIDRLAHHATILEFNGDSHRAHSANAVGSRSSLTRRSLDFAPPREPVGRAAVALRASR